MRKLAIFLMFISINSYAGFLDPEIMREAGEGAATGNIESIQKAMKDEEDAKRRLEEFYKSREQYSHQFKNEVAQPDDNEVLKQKMHAEKIKAQEDKKNRHEKIRIEKISKTKEFIKRKYDKEFSTF